MQNNTRNEREGGSEKSEVINKVYEIGFIFVSSIPQEKVAEQTESFKAVLTKNGADIIDQENPELMPLAYTMIKKIQGSNRRFDEGYFGWVKFELGPDAVASVKKALDADDNILRYLLMITPREKTYLGKRAPIYASANRDAGMIAPESVMQEPGDSKASAGEGKDATISIDTSESAAVSPVVSVEEMDKSIDEMVKGV